MEEVVRAFNFVIEKGWVRVSSCEEAQNIGIEDANAIHRHSIGQRLSGLRERLKKPIVSLSNSLLPQPHA